MSYKQVLTDAGRDVIAKGQTGLVVTFTRVVLGEGEIEDPAVIPTMTVMLDPVMETNIVAIARTGIGQVTITAKVPLASIPRDFHLDEIGVFATVGNEPEVLYGYSYATDPAKADIISQDMAGGSKSEHTIQIAVVIGSTENVTAILAPDFEIINIGTAANGIGWYKDRVGNTFRFKRFAGGGDVQLVEEEDDIRLSVQGVPTGVTLPFFGVNVPNGYLLCDGRTYPKAEFPALATELGNRYGGDANNFAVPDCRNRTLIGASLTRPFGSIGGEEAHQLSVAELASHAHQLYDPGHNHSTYDIGHNHNHSDPGHAHSSPAHSHSVPWETNEARAGEAGQPGWTWQGWDYGVTYGSGNIARYTFPNGSGATAVTITGAGTGIQNIAAVTGLQIQLAYPTAFGMYIQNTGSNQPHNNMPPYIAINYIIRT